MPLESRDSSGKMVFNERSCDPDWIRTNDLLLRRQLLYPAELPNRFLSSKIVLPYLKGGKNKF